MTDRELLEKILQIVEKNHARLVVLERNTSGIPQIVKDVQSISIDIENIYKLLEKEE